MFDILSGIGSLINPASAIASTVLGQLFGEDRQQQAPQVMYPQAPPQQVIVQEPPPPPVHPLVETGYFNNAFANGGLVGPPGPLSQFLTAGGATTIQGVNGRELPAIQAINPGFAPMANQLNQWLSGDLSFMSPVGYADGGRVGSFNERAYNPMAKTGREDMGISSEIPDEDLIELAMSAIAGVSENPDEIIQEFTNRFGEQALMDLASRAKSMGNIYPQSDGLSDSVPAIINGQTPAALSEGEFVMPADVVSGIGNGSTNAGAKRLLEMIDNVRRARTGRDAAPPKIRVER